MLEGEDDGQVTLRVRSAEDLNLPQAPAKSRQTDQPPSYLLSCFSAPITLLGHSLNPAPPPPPYVDGLERFRLCGQVPVVLIFSSLH
jgi:hypothetical protein